MASLSSTYRIFTVLLIVCSCDDVIGQAIWGKHDRQTTNTLYSENANIVELYQGNLTNTVTRSTYAWAVQFYASWCGHCQRFKPVWIELARDTKAWNNMIKLGSVACSHPENIDVCRTHHINYYPTVMYYPPNSAHDFRGLTSYICPETVAGMRMCLVDFLEGVIVKPLWWPPLQAFTNIREIQDHSKRMDYEDLIIMILFEEPPDSRLEVPTEENYLGRELMLDMSIHNKRLFMARMLRSYGVNYGVTAYPSLYRLNEDGSITFIAQGLNRETFGYLIERDILGVINPAEKDKGIYGQLVTTVKPVLPDGVHMQDLESALYYSLYQEVAMRDEIEGEALQALKTHISTLTQFLPVTPHVTNWLQRVKNWLNDQTKVRGKVWSDTISALQTKDAFLPERVIWTGCLGSKPHFRGYPCSLWTTFHTLTVSAYKQNASTHGSKLGPKDVLLSVKGFIKHFFSCRECRDNFVDKEAKNLEEEVKTPEDAILWLWRVHNKVNRRLQDDPTDDPRHPKMMFPAYAACAACYKARPGGRDSKVEFSETGVLNHLLTFYGRNHIIDDTSPYVFRAVKSFYYSSATSSVYFSSQLSILTATAVLLLFSNLYLKS